MEKITLPPGDIWKRFVLIFSACSSSSFSIFSFNIINEKNAYNVLADRFSNVTNPTVDESVNERLNFYTTAVKSLAEKPLLGIGIGNWKIKSIELNKDIIQNYTSSSIPSIATKEPGLALLASSEIISIASSSFPGSW